MAELNITKIYHNGQMTGYGGDQDWFLDPWAVKAGCGSVLGSNLYAYYKGIETAAQSDFLNIMNDLYSHMTPGKMGYPYFYKFAHVFIDRMKDEGMSFSPLYLKKSKSAAQSVAFVKKAIDAKHPVGVLILHHAAPEMKEDNWHWVCITGYSESDTGVDIIFSDCGDRKVIGADIFFDPNPVNVVKLVSFRQK